jgi:chaperone modulatory protein CbpM
MTASLLPVVIGRGRPLMSQDEFARRSALHPDLLRRFVALGLLPAVRGTDGSLWFTGQQLADAARLQRLRATLPLNYAALGLVVDLLDRITELETVLRIRGRTEPLRPRPGTQRPTPNPEERSVRWTSTA